MRRVARLAVVAGVLAGICVFGELYGALACVLIGAVAAGIAVRRHAITANGPFAEFRSWLIAGALFAAWVVVLIPFTSHLAVTLGLLCFTPVFGTQVIMVDGAIKTVIGPSPAEAERVKPGPD